MKSSVPVNPRPKDTATALNHLKNTINFLLGRISAFMCGFFILFLGAMFISTWVTNIIGIDLSSRYQEPGRLAGYLMMHVVLLAPILYCGVACARFLLRAMPPQLSGRVRFRAILITLPLTLICTLTSVSILIFSMASSETLQARGTSLIAAVFLMPLLTWWAGVVSPLYVQRLKPYDFLERPFILFLRRFSNFSDRAVINLILGQTPLGKPVVFLTPSRSLAGDWNPFLVGFAGMKFLHPFRSVPITLRSSDYEWKQSAQYLMHRAQIIVFDISTGSGAIETEFEMISQASYWPKTIFLKEDARTADCELAQKIRLRGAQILYYRKSWIRGLPRMILGFAALMSLPVVTIFLVVAGMTGSILVIMLGGILGLWTWAWLYYSFFVRPSIDSRAKSLLRMMLLADRKSSIS